MHTIIHIGAGASGELDGYLASTAEQIVLVEPQPALAASLRARAGDDHRVSVIEAAVNGDGTAATLHQFNLPEASSLCEPTGLLQLFPGLRTENRFQVDTVTLADLVTQFPVPDGKSAWLIVDAPGSEQEILQAFFAGTKTNPFSDMRVVSPDASLYGSGSHAGAIITATGPSRFRPGGR